MNLLLIIRIRKKIEIEGKEYKLMEYYKTKKNDKLEIKIKGIENFSNMEYMLSDCSSLLKLPNISKWNTSIVNKMSFMFYGCTSLSYLPDIYRWNITNVKDMRAIFWMLIIIKFTRYIKMEYN